MTFTDCMTGSIYSFDGFDPADVDAEFEAIWTGAATGFSESKLRGDLAGDRQALADLHAHRITPRSVVGTGYKNGRKVAVEYLTKRIADGERDVESRGRTNSVNQSNVHCGLRKAAGTW